MRDVRPLRATEGVNMTRRTFLYVGLLVLATAVTAESTVLSQTVRTHEPGLYATRISGSTRSQIEQAVSGFEPGWASTPHTMCGGHGCLFEFAKGDQFLRIEVTFMESSAEATKQLDYRLNAVALPEYRPLEGVGDEAFLVTDRGPILFRAGTAVVSVKRNHQYGVAAGNLRAARRASRGPRGSGNCLEGTGWGGPCVEGGSNSLIGGC
jgi:hypothetical protein